MIVLGVDPGTLITGYGVINVASSRTVTLVEYGIVESKKISSLPLRLEAIFLRLSAVIDRTLPDEFAIETAFYDKNIQSTLKLGHARGVAMLAAVLKQLPTAEYAPREIKKAVTGNGAASKEQVKFMVRTLLSLPEEDKKFDAYDALAVAITHSVRRGGSGTGAARNWKDFITQNPERVVGSKS